MIDPASFAARPPELPLLMTASVLIQARDPIRSSLRKPDTRPELRLIVLPPMPGKPTTVSGSPACSVSETPIGTVGRVSGAPESGRPARSRSEVFDDGGIKVAVRRDDARAVFGTAGWSSDSMTATTRSSGSTSGVGSTRTRRDRPPRAWPHGRS